VRKLFAKYVTKENPLARFHWFQICSPLKATI